MITRENYEIYFIDFLEGKLSKEDDSMLELFLQENEDLKLELDQFSEFNPIEMKEEIQVDFSHLKKQSLIGEHNEADFFIGKIEGDLEEKELKMLHLYFIEFPEKKKVYESFERTKLKPQTLIFPNKYRLKQSRKIGYYYYLVSGLAACLIALFYYNISLNEGDKKVLVASNGSYRIELEEGFSTLKPLVAMDEIPVEEKKNRSSFLTPPKEKNIPVILREEIEVNKMLSKSIEIKPNIEKEIDVPNLAQLEIANNNNNKEENILSVKEYAKLKAIRFVEEKTIGKKDNTEDLLAYATKKITTLALSNQVEYGNKETEKQIVKTFKVGNLFTVTRKTKK